MVTVAVIGGGPAGLVTLKYLLAAEEYLGSKANVRLFEADSTIGGAFQSRTYEGGELVSSRQLTTFSDFRWKRGPDFMTVEQYREYLVAYCNRFQLTPNIELRCRVTDIRSDGIARRIICYTKDGERYGWSCDAVAICTGLHVYPNNVTLDGIGNISNTIHSAQFKSSVQFGNAKTVLILGSGETAADIAHLAVTSGSRRVVLCHRDGFHLAPKRSPKPRCVWNPSSTSSTQIPIDISRASLFDTMYLHPLLRSSNILWNYYDYYLRTILWLSWGTTHGSDQWIGGKPAGWSASRIFFNKAGHKIAPYIDPCWRPHGIRWALRSVFTTPDKPNGRLGLKEGHIDIAPWPSHIDSHGNVHFQDNKRPEYNRMKIHPLGPVNPDMVIFCTGYKPLIPFLNDDDIKRAGIEGSHDRRAGEFVYQPQGLLRGVWPHSDPSLAFIGFVRPNLGAIPPLAEMQAQLWVTKLLAPSRLSSMSINDEPHYQLHCSDNSRLTHGVDHESYAYQLALDMGSAISLFDVIRLGMRSFPPMRGRFSKTYAQSGDRAIDIDASSRSTTQGMWYKLPITWALGANFNAKFRLQGPWAEEQAVLVMSDELWETIARREIIFGHITLSAIPIMIFGPLSLILYLVTCLSPDRR